eukprot:IDg19313t1
MPQMLLTVWQFASICAAILIVFRPPAFRPCRTGTMSIVGREISSHLSCTRSTMYTRSDLDSTTRRGPRQAKHSLCALMTALRTRTKPQVLKLVGLTLPRREP